MDVLFLKEVEVSFHTVPMAKEGKVMSIKLEGIPVIFFTMSSALVTVDIFIHLILHDNNLYSSSSSSSLG